MLCPSPVSGMRWQWYGKAMAWRGRRVGKNGCHGGLDGEEEKETKEWQWGRGGSLKKEQSECGAGRGKRGKKPVTWTDRH